MAEYANRQDLFMQTLAAESRSDSLPFNNGRPMAELSLVEVAEQLERVTSWIEAERVREREARSAYESVRQQTESRIDEIRKYAQELVGIQRRRMSSFDGLLGKQDQAAGNNSHAARFPRAPMAPAIGASSGKKNIAEAILDTWNLDPDPQPMTTEDIIAALPHVGYTSKAAAASLKSSVNQALAKLCRVGKVVRLRADGSVIPVRDKTSRARKYIAASKLPEDQVL